MPLMRYCPACGQALPVVDTPPNSVVSQDCPSCGAIHYRNAKPTAGAMLVRDGKLLLCRRGVEPYTALVCCRGATGADRLRGKPGGAATLASARVRVQLGLKFC